MRTSVAVSFLSALITNAFGLLFVPVTEYVRTGKASAFQLPESGIIVMTVLFSVGVFALVYWLIRLVQLRALQQKVSGLLIGAREAILSSMRMKCQGAPIFRPNLDREQALRLLKLPIGEVYDTGEIGWTIPRVEAFFYKLVGGGDRLRADLDLKRMYVSAGKNLQEWSDIGFANHVGPNQLTIPTRIEIPEWGSQVKWIFHFKPSQPSKLWCEQYKVEGTGLLEKNDADSIIRIAKLAAYGEELVDVRSRLA